MVAEFALPQHAGSPYLASSALMVGAEFPPLLKLAEQSQSWVAPRFRHLVYDDANSCHVAVTRDETNEDQITGLVIHRPCGDRRLWDSVYRVLKSGQWVLYFPTYKPPLIVADGVNAQHVPAEMREALGAVHVVGSGDEIVQIIRRS